MSAEDEFSGSKLVALLPLRWTALGVIGIEVLAGPPRGSAIPLRYRTRDASPATAEDGTGAGNAGSRKKGGAR
jgi:hypothetical protein